LARAEPPLLEREVRERRERDDRHGEREIALDRREERGRVTAEAHPHHADAGSAARLQERDERAEIVDRLTEAFVRHARVRTRKRRRPSPILRSAKRVEWKD